MAKSSRQPRATTAWYDVPARRVVMELGSGYQVGIPVAQLKEIAGAPAEQLAAVKVLGGGNILHWETLDADYSVPALVLGMVSRTLLAREAARAAGKTKSPLKAAAARKNGKKGGRPRAVSRR